MEYKFNSKEHIHTLDGKPLCGTSTVLGIVAKPLTWWASGLAVKEIGGIEDCKVLTKYKNGKASPSEVTEIFAKSTYSLERIKEMSIESFIQLLGNAYSAHAKKLTDSAETGTDMHAELEKYVKNCIETNSGIPLAHSVDEVEPVSIFVSWACENIKKFLWSELYCYSTVHWLGGISDCGAELKDGSYAIIDFKSSKEAYPSQAWQIAGYDIQISENGGYTENGEKIFNLDKPISQYIVVPFGAKKVEPMVFTDVEGSKRAFLGALTVYKEQQTYEK